jgi:alkaline phosphatase D
MNKFVITIAISLLSLTANAADFRPAKPMPSATLDDDQLITRIAIGSCLVPTRDASIFNEISKTNADLFLFIGDNVYAETEKNDPNLKSLKAGYGMLADSPPFTSLRKSMPVMVTWDDHDFGINDGGGDWSHKQASQALYNHVWAIDRDDERASRDGVYYSRVVGPEGQRVQFILLDTRYFRTPLTKAEKRFADGGRYLKSDSDSQNMLGDTQWAWLEEQLQVPADVRIIATSVQMIADGHNWEAWRLMPDEQARFYQLLTKTGANGVVLVSGDRHSSAIYRQTDNVPYPLWEMTASSLNLPLTAILKNITTEPGPNRVGQPFYDANFGVIDIDWPNRKLILQIQDETGSVVLAANVGIDELTIQAVLTPEGE